MSDPSPQSMFFVTMSMPDGIPQAECARAVCQIRHLDPYFPVSTPYGILPQWKALVFEQHLLRLAAL